jgi:hypothetical protein
VRHLTCLLKRVALGGTALPQEFTVGLAEPNSEISVWLYGAGELSDVTTRVTTACTAPLTICVGFDKDEILAERSFHKAVLKFCERGQPGRVLGEICLRLHSALSIDVSKFVLFRVQGSANYCLPRAQRWTHYVLQAYAQLRRSYPPDIRMTLREQRAACVTFIRPHPLCLGSLGDEACGNMFPMNLMGDLGGGYLGFALRKLRLAAHFVERAGRLAISGIPLSWCSVPFQLAGNHKKESIDWKELPFETKPSPLFRIPVPAFATRVREMQIEQVHQLGSHRFFIARTVSDETYAEGLQACVVHGFYQFWRLKGDSAMLKASVAEDAIRKTRF